MSNDDADADHTMCFYDVALLYARRPDHFNDFESNAQSFKNHLMLRDRGFVADAFRSLADKWEQAGE
jgi:hypothetical protein